MKTNLEQRLAVALVSDKVAASVLAKCDVAAALSKTEKDALAIALADKAAAEEVEKVLEARADVAAKAAAKNAADAAAAADEEDEDLAAAAAAAASALAAAQAAKAALVPMSRNARDRISVALADAKAGAELVGKIQA